MDSAALADALASLDSKAVAAAIKAAVGAVQELYDGFDERCIALEKAAAERDGSAERHAASVQEQLTAGLAAASAAAAAAAKATAAIAASQQLSATPAGDAAVAAVAATSSALETAVADAQFRAESRRPMSTKLLRVLALLSRALGRTGFDHVSICPTTAFVVAHPFILSLFLLLLLQMVAVADDFQRACAAPGCSVDLAQLDESAAPLGEYARALVALVASGDAAGTAASIALTKSTSTLRSQWFYHGKDAVFDSDVFPDTLTGWEQPRSVRCVPLFSISCSDDAVWCIAEVSTPRRC